MDKIEIQLVILDSLPFKLNINKIQSYNSDLFQINSNLINIPTPKTNTPFLEDKSILNLLPKEQNSHLLFLITYAPLENNDYTRRLESNKIVISYHGIYQIMQENNIEPENLVKRFLQSYSLIYKSENDTIPLQNEDLKLEHIISRACLFDLPKDKKDLIFSLEKPIICNDCQNHLKSKKETAKFLKTSKQELLKIKQKKIKKLYQFVQSEPLLSLILSAIFGITISVLANIIFDFIKDN